MKEVLLISCPKLLPRRFFLGMAGFVLSASAEQLRNLFTSGRHGGCYFFDDFFFVFFFVFFLESESPDEDDEEDEEEEEEDEEDEEELSDEELSDDEELDVESFRLRFFFTELSEAICERPPSREEIVWVVVLPTALFFWASCTV